MAALDRSSRPAATGAAGPHPDAAGLPEEAALQVAFDGAPVGMAVTALEPGRETEYLRVNPALARMLGRSPAQMVGCRALDDDDPDQTGTDATLIAEVLRGYRAHHSGQKRLRRSDGSILWARVTAAVVRDAGGPVCVLEHVQDVTSSREVERERTRRATLDPLTGLVNRETLLDHLRRAALDLGRSGGALAVLFCDLDRFKTVNDTLGHDAGDAVLRTVAERLAATVRGGEVVGRLAGDEFLVVARVDEERLALRVAERLVAALAPPLEVAGRLLTVRSSIGVATTRDPSVDIDDLLRSSDRAMYRAKRSPRTGGAVPDARLHEEAVGRAAMERVVRRALEQGGLRLEFQPVVDLRSGRVAAAEALVRIDDPDRGTVLPEAFLAAAEDSGLIVPVSAWALAEACRQLAVWQRTHASMRVCLDVSPQQVVHLVLLDQVRAAAAASGVSPSGLDLELSERVLLDADVEVAAELGAVAEAGCRIVVDDFGTGCSSLGCITRFPVTALKVGGDFVAGIGERARAAGVIEAMLGVARALGLETVVEGVETRQQAERLLAMGCRLAQGTHLGRPMPGDQLHGLLLDAR